MPKTDRERAINDLAADLPPYWPGVPFDAPIMHAALEALRTRQPRVLYVMLGETDEWAHEGRYDLYLDAAFRSDRFLARLWDTLQAMPALRESDGARSSRPITAAGATATDWTDHGRKVPAAEATWMAVMGPGVPALGVRESVTVTTSQVAATVAALVGEDFRDGRAGGSGAAARHRRSAGARGALKPGTSRRPDHVGAGPAGSGAARLLAAWGHSVLIVDRPGKDERALAESIPPSARKVLVGPRHARRRSKTPASCRGRATSCGGRRDRTAGEPRVESFPPGVAGFQVVRRDFDARLRALAAESGATVESRHRARRPTPDSPAGVRVIEAAGQTREVTAAIVLDCSGRSGRRRAAGPAPRGQRRTTPWRWWACGACKTTSGVISRTLRDEMTPEVV